MAERSFAREVQQLKVPAGTEFRGEGILAVTKGLGASSASAFNAGSHLGANKRAIAFMGDGGFWHNGLTSGIGNAVFNKHDNLFVIADNNYSAATGGQDISSSRTVNPNRSTMHAIERAVRGVGVQWVRTITRTYDVAATRAALHEALTTQEPGPQVVIAQSECMLNRQRRERPAAAVGVKAAGASSRRTPPCCAHLSTGRTRFTTEYR
jgi:indolepyruvate ferredoxin oxidoreductase alpha subunit